MSRRTIGWALVASGILAGAGATLLSARFGWPARLDDPAAVALPAFIAESAAIRIGFALELVSSLLLVPAILGLGRLIGPAAQVWTVFGVAGAFVQTLGWVRWPITVPQLAEAYAVQPPGSAGREAVGASYDLLNAYAGGALGEHLGWLFLGVWALGAGALLTRIGLARWFTALGLALSAGWVPLLMVAGYQGTHAGFAAEVGSLVFTIWLVWLLVAGVLLLVKREPTQAERASSPAAMTAR